MLRFTKLCTLILCLLLVCGAVAGCTSNKEQAVVELTISAAASLTNALTEIKSNYELEQTNITLNFNYGASGALQQQIEQGAPTDIFFSAASRNMNALVDQQLIANGENTSILNNELVVVVPASSQLAIDQMEDLVEDNVQHVAIGIPDTVPAGGYAREALTNSQLWESLQSRMVQAKDVRQVLTYVESGNAEVGFVYRTDAISSDGVRVAFSVDPTTYTTIEYPVGIVTTTKHRKEAEDFYTYVQTKEALDVFLKYGFSVPK